MPNTAFPTTPAEVPQYNSRVVRCLGRYLLKLVGWKIVGEVPRQPKVILAAAPHTSNWDFVVAMFAIMGLGVKLSYLMKKEAFFWPFKGLFMALGGIPLDRSAARNTVNQICSWFEKEDKLWVVITPEGTRSKVERWKTGFLRASKQADVPIVLIAWDYPSKSINIEKLWRATDNIERDAEEIRDYIRKKYTGKYPEKQ